MRLPDCQPEPNDPIVSRGPAAAARSPAQLHGFAPKPDLEDAEPLTVPAVP